MSKRDYYEILGVERSADAKEIKAAYRRLALKFHPDRNPDNKEAEASFKEATEAYEVLSDDAKRQRYNQFGHDGMRGGQDFHQYSNVGDIFEQFFGGGGGGGSIFDDFFGGQGRGGARQAQGQPGADLKIDLTLSLEEVASGVEKTLKYKRWAACDTCSGTGAKSGKTAVCRTCGGNGQVQNVRRTVFGQFVNVATCPACQGSGQTITENCETCKGDGRVQEEKTIKVKVPAGVAESNYIPFRGKGHAGRRGGPAGDLIVAIHEKEHEYFVRDNSDIHYNLQISYPQAVLGAEVDVPTLAGESTVKIEPGTQPGTRLRMRDKGVPKLQSHGRGDQIIHINVYVPRAVNSKEKQLLKDMARNNTFSPDGKPDEKSSRDFFDKVREAFS